MQFWLSGVQLRPGLLLNMSAATPFGLAIRMALARAYRRLTGDPHPIRNCPSHSAMIVWHSERPWIAHAMPPRCGLQSTSAFQALLDRGHYYNLRILEVVGATPAQEAAASSYWLDNIRGSPYDAIAMPRLLAKAIFGDLINTPAGVPWANWCTEANMLAWRKGAGLDPYANKNPTPLTELKRALEGLFRQLDTGKQ